MSLKSLATAIQIGPPADFRDAASVATCLSSVVVLCLGGQRNRLLLPPLPQKLSTEGSLTLGRRLCDFDASTHPSSQHLIQLQLSSTVTTKSPLHSQSLGRLVLTPNTSKPTFIGSVIKSPRQKWSFRTVPQLTWPLTCSPRPCLDRIKLDRFCKMVGIGACAIPVV